MSTNNDGLTSDEKTNILFKKLTSSISTNNGTAFFNETAFPSNKNIFSDSILQKTPGNGALNEEFFSDISGETNLGGSSKAQYLQALLQNDDPNIYITDAWFDDKYEKGAEIKISEDRLSLRILNLDLDYISDTHAFACMDASTDASRNILKNLIPGNFGKPSYFGQGLNYSTTDDIGNKAGISQLSERGTDFNFGAPLIDNENGIVTFYDTVEITPSANFTGYKFYITCTKYVGKKGVSVSSLENPDFQSYFEQHGTFQNKWSTWDGNNATPLEISNNQVHIYPQTGFGSFFSPYFGHLVFKSAISELTYASLTFQDFAGTRSAHGNNQGAYEVNGNVIHNHSFLNVSVRNKSDDTNSQGNYYSEQGRVRFGCKVGINTNYDDDDSSSDWNSTHSLHVIGSIYTNSTLTAGSTCSANSFNATSDIRFKENIVELENPLQKILSLRAVNYNFKEHPETKHAGVIAQEVDKIIPEAVNKNDDDKWSLNYNSLFSYYIEAMKELNKKIDEKDEEMEKEKAKTAKLETQMKDLLERT